MKTSSIFLLLILVLILWGTFFSCSSNKKCHCCNWHHSKKHLSNFQASTLEINSSATLENTKISEEAEINGKGTITNCSFGSLEINGRGYLDHATVEKKIEINGSGELFFCSCNELEINGSGTLQDTQVTNHCEINGSTTTSRSSFGSLEINGQATLDSVTIEKDAEINGDIAGKNISCPSMNVNSLQISFENSKLGTLTITYKTPLFSSAKTPVVILTDTTVEKIVFKHNPGKVILKGSTKITTQQVSNGTIE